MPKAQLKFNERVRYGNHTSRFADWQPKDRLIDLPGRDVVAPEDAEVKLVADVLLNEDVALLVDSYIVTETESMLTLGDVTGQSHVPKKDQLEELQILELSIMPEGLENGFTDTEFVDVRTFLAEQK